MIGTYYIPPSVLNPIYSLQEITAIILVVTIVIHVLFANKFTKYVISVLLLLLLILHYYILYRMSSLEEVTLYPFIVIESSKAGYSSMSIDMGQIIALILLYLWWNRIKPSIKIVYLRIISIIKRITRGQGQ